MADLVKIITMSCSFDEKLSKLENLLSSNLCFSLYSTQGSNITIQAGASHERETPGGAVMINGGLGSSRTGPAKYHGGDGGNVHITGGGSAGNHVLNDRAGNVILEGGRSNGAGIGGSIQLLSGAGSESGVLMLETRATESFTGCRSC